MEEASGSAFRQMLAEQHYYLQLQEEHRLAEEEKQGPRLMEEALVSAFRQLLAEQHYYLQLLEERRLAKDQLEAKRASELVIATMVVADLAILDVYWDMPGSVNSARTICCERSLSELQS